MRKSLKDKRIVKRDIGLSYSEQIQAHCKINEAEAKSLLNKYILKKTIHKTTKIQGDALEKVVDYFLRKSGLFTNVRADFKSSVHQIDHHAMFQPHVARIYFQLFEDGTAKVLGESKNYSKHKKPLGVDIVYKVEGIKSRVGYTLAMYFTRGGMTGDEFRAATKLIHDFCNSSKTLSVVFSDDDWEFLKKRPKLFQKLLFAKIEHFNVTNNFKVNYAIVPSWGN
ncbi:MAG: hypothetical protein AB7O96_06490 [Pseudobdellovibrionaceae bacterium]